MKVFLKTSFVMISLVFILLLALEANCVYFSIHKDKPKCILEELYKGTIASISYQTLEDLTEDKEHDHTPLFLILIYDTLEDKQIESFQGEKHHGKVLFNIFKDATYKLCVNANPESYLFDKMEKMKIKLAIESYADLKDLDANEPDALKSDDIKDLDSTLTKVHSKVIDIMRTQNYQMLREEEYSNKQVTNSKVLLYLTVAQIVLIIFFTMWQFSSLKNLLVDSIN